MHLLSLTALTASFLLIVSPSILTFALPHADPDTTTNSTTALSPREIDIHKLSGLKLEAWSDDSCTGATIVERNVRYDSQHDVSDLPQGMKSYRIHRDLDPAEQLDFSQPKIKTKVVGYRNKNKRDWDLGKIPDKCFNYWESAASGTKANCWTLDEYATCYRLWHH